MKLLVRFAFTFAVAAVLCFPAAAQKIPSKLAFNLGAGFTPLVGDISHRLDTGWNFDLGAGYKFTKFFSLNGEYQYNGLGISRSALNALNVPDGNAHIFSLTVDPMLQVNPDGRFGAYAIGGGGFYHRVVQFTRPTLVPTFVFDPWFGAIFPALVPANIVLGTFTDDSGGVNLGGGLTYKLGSTGAKLYTEARYNWMDTPHRDTQFIPVTFGIRW